MEVSCVWMNEYKGIATTPFPLRIVNCCQIATSPIDELRTNHMDDKRLLVHMA